MPRSLLPRARSEEARRLKAFESEWCTQSQGAAKCLFFGRGNFDPLAPTKRGSRSSIGWRGAYYEKHRGDTRVRVKGCGKRFHTILEAVEHIIKYQSETAVTEETVVLAPLASNNKKMQRLSQLEEQYSTQRLGPVKGLFLGRGNFDPLAATNRGKPNKTGWRDAYFEKHRGQPRVRVKDCGSRFHTVLEAAEHIIKMNEVSRQASAAVAAVKATPGAAPAAPVPVAALIAPEAAPTLAEERIPPPPVLSRNITKPTDFPWSLLSQELTAMPVQRVIPILSNCIPIASLLLTHRACSMLAEPFASGIANGGKGFEFKSKEGLTALLQKKSDGWCALYASKGEDKDQKLAKFKAHMLMRDPTLNGTTLPTGVLLGLIRYVDN